MWVSTSINRDCCRNNSYRWWIPLPGLPEATWMFDRANWWDSDWSILKKINNDVRHDSIYIDATIVKYIYIYLQLICNVVYIYICLYVNLNTYMSYHFKLHHITSNYITPLLFSVVPKYFFSFSTLTKRTIQRFTSMSVALGE